MPLFSVSDSEKCCVRANKSVLEFLVQNLDEAQYGFFLRLASQRPITRSESDSFNFPGGGSEFLRCNYVAYRDMTTKSRRKIVELFSVEFCSPADISRETERNAHSHTPLAKAYYFGGIVGYLSKIWEWLRHWF